MSGLGNKQVKGSNCNEILPNEDGSLNVKAEIVDSLNNSVEVISHFDEAVGVASGATETIIEYTVPTNKKFYLQRIEYSGQNIATYEAYGDGNLIGRERTWFGGNINDMMEFSSDPKTGILFVAGSVVSLRVINFRPYVATFEGRIQGILQDA